MGANLHPCPSCARHVRVCEPACPFCGAATPEGFASLVRVAPPGIPLTRAALLFAGAAAVAGCGGTTSTTGGDSGAGTDSAAMDANSSTMDSAFDGPDPVPMYGAAMVDAHSDVGLPILYGPAPVPDAGPEPDATLDGPMPGPMYGPAPVDAGDG